MPAKKCLRQSCDHYLYIQPQISALHGFMRLIKSF